MSQLIREEGHTRKGYDRKTNPCPWQPGVLRNGHVDDARFQEAEIAEGNEYLVFNVHTIPGVYMNHFLYFDQAQA
jgi:hypothetical protein